MNDNGQQIGVIHEVGDLGLGFNPISKEDAQILEEQKRKENNKED